MQATLPHATPAVHPIPTGPDGTIVPRLLPVAAYLCGEQYGPEARSAVLERMAAGVGPIVLALTGLLEWADVRPVEDIMGGRSPYGGPIRPIRCGSPEAAPARKAEAVDMDDFPVSYDRMRAEQPARYREEMRRREGEIVAWFADHREVD